MVETMQQPTPDDVAPAPKRLITYEEAAQRIGVAQGTLRSWVSRKMIPHYRLGKGLVRFAELEIDAWLESKHKAFGVGAKVTP